LDLLEITLLIGVGILSGVINTLAGGGSLLSVPLLVFLGLPGDVANGTNRVGVLIQCVTATWRFRADGIPGVRRALVLFVPVGLGSLLGAGLIAQLPAAQFERLFGVVMILLLIPTLRTGSGAVAPANAGERRWSPSTRFLVFFGIGVYGGAIQAGVGLVVMMALSRDGVGLVESNNIKVILVLILTAIAVPVFIFADQIAWVAALYLVIGFALGGAAGARLTVFAGERLIKPVLGAAVALLAARMLSLY
jgi:uncharacterized membrane protein YfcA